MKIVEVQQNNTFCSFRKGNYFGKFKMVHFCPAGYGSFYYGSAFLTNTIAILKTPSLSILLGKASNFIHMVKYHQNGAPPIFFLRNFMA